MAADLLKSEGRRLALQEPPEFLLLLLEENCQWRALRPCYIEGVGYRAPHRGTACVPGVITIEASLPGETREPSCASDVSRLG